MKLKRTTGLVMGLLAIGVLTGVAGCMTEKGKSTRVRDFHTELFGENTYIFSPEDDPEEVQEVLDEIYEKQETNQFGDERYAVCFLPGEYDESLEVNVGFYTQVLGLGGLPTDTKIPKLSCLARWLGDDPSNHNACCNFWRSVENIGIESNTIWAVSQATDMRRVYIDGALYLHDDYGWCSGGFLADSKTEFMVDSGSQQQWLSRNNDYKTWMGENWNIVFSGDEENGLPEGTWPAKSYTVIDATPVVREKPFLVYDEKEGFGVFVPNLREESTGVSWEDGCEGSTIPIDEFYVAKADSDTAETINEALESGKHLLLTPGVYELEEPVTVTNPDTVVLGMGLATLRAVNGSSCLEVADEDGIIVAGILFDAGNKESEYLLSVGDEESDSSHSQNPICLSDVYFRVGGADADAPAKVKTCVEIHSNDVIGDNFWVWRADHGDQVAWDLNTTENGIVVNGDNVTIYALMVEHFHEYQTIWNGNNGTVYMYQSEIPYDVPEQSVWMSHDGAVDGYASFYVGENVTDFEAQGLGIYLYNRDAEVTLHSAMELPDAEGVRVHHICTVMLTGYPGMEHIINDAGESVTYAGEVQLLIDYENGQYK